jgi:poly-gamma-glutamate biosynthesis protein PgsC/CapC
VIELAIGLGIFFGIFFYEFFGLTAGGLVAPGYLALFLDQPVRVAGTLVVSLGTFGLVRWLSGYMILFGRRRFALTMLLSFLIRAVWEILLVNTPIDMPGLRVIGYIVPGLIANEMERQGVFSTLGALTVVAALVRLCLLALRGWAPFP